MKNLEEIKPTARSLSINAIYNLSITYNRVLLPHLSPLCLSAKANFKGRHKE